LSDNNTGRLSGVAEVSTIVPVRRVRKAYEQVADQLRDLILSGEVAPDQRLPNEAALAAQFGVSRPTIREALRELSAMSLIRTTKGASGGSFVTVPTVEYISRSLCTNIHLLSRSEHVSLDEFLEARDLLEVAAARLAASRRTEEDLEKLRAAIPGPRAELPRDEQFSYNKLFHSTLVLAADNTLLSICAQPVFSVLQSNLERSTQSRRFHQRVNDDHRVLVDLLESGDAEASAAQMHEHLSFLRPVYEKLWRYEAPGQNSSTRGAVASGAAD
jgi:GntR family transcriptional repressor for pyruvate dehydrogenase complex